MQKSVFLFLVITYTQSPTFAKDAEIKVKEIPISVIKPCFDETGRIAEIGGLWNHSDVGLGGGKYPRARLLKVCKDQGKSWIVLCQKGGYSSTYVLAKSSSSNGKDWNPPVVTDSPAILDLECK